MSWWASVALLGSAMSLALATAGPATVLDSIPGTCAVTPGESRFVFRSGFWLNLHNFLHRDPKARRGIHDEVPAALTVTHSPGSVPFRDRCGRDRRDGPKIPDRDRLNRVNGVVRGARTCVDGRDRGSRVRR